MTELLRTKLYIPRPRSNLVSRPRLTDSLNAGLDRRLSLIAAPAGFGKTTLLSEWIPRSPRCVTWLSLDEGDDDLTRFWVYFVAALQTVSPAIGENTLALLNTPQPPPIETLFPGLINSVAAFPDSFVQVLDDYHLISNPAIHQALAFFIDHQPANMHLVITSRIDPLLPLARWRARDELNDLRANDLRFNLDEATDFLRQVMGLDLSTAEVAILEQRIEGWIAGLQLAALSMQAAGDVDSFIRAFTGSSRYIVDYLVEEVLNQQPQGTLNFLLQTALLDRLCGPLCDAVTGASGGQRLLADLERAKLFINPLDDEGVWYRYHPLFAEVLRYRLQQAAAGPTRDVVAPAELHRRASAWFEREGLIDEAIQHALAAPDVGRAAALVERYSIIMLQQSQVLLIRAWLERLPPELVQSRPRLVLAHGWILVLTGDGRDLDRWLAAPPARAALAAPDLPADILGELALLRAVQARFRREDTLALELAQQALEQLADDDRGLQAGALYTIGVAWLRKGDIAAASQAFVETVRLGETRGGPYMALDALEELSELHIREGRLSRAIQTCQQARRMVARRGWQAMPAAGMADIHLGRVLYERNDLLGATTALADGIGRLRGSIEQFVLARGYVALGRVQLARGDIQGALATIRQGADWFAQMQVTDTGAGALLELGKARLALGMGDLNPARRWAQSCRWRPEDTQLGYLQAVTLVRLRLAQNRRQAQPHDLRDAAAMVDRLLSASEAQVWSGRVIELLVLQTLLYQAQDNIVGMRASVERALALAEPEGYVRIFVDEGRPMAEVLQQVQQRGRFPGYSGKLLAAFPAAELAPRAADQLPEPLSERELEVLRLVATGASNQAIAAQLFIALSTVKKHVGHILVKLDTPNRVQAIARARELGLLT